MSDIFAKLAKQAFHTLTTDEKSKAVDAATGILRADYYDDVRDLANSLVEEIVKGEIDDRATFDDRLHEAVDGSGRVIYTWQARLGLLSSDNEDAAADEMGAEDAPTTPEGRMYFALRADVLEEIASRASLGTNVNGESIEFDDDSTWPANVTKADE
jgi:hypothetical protein